MVSWQAESRQVVRNLIERWVPDDGSIEPAFGLHEVLYATLGPQLSQQLVDLVGSSTVVANDGSKDCVSKELFEVVEQLRNEIGRAPTQLFLLGTALAGLETALRHLHHDEAGLVDQDFLDDGDVVGDRVDHAELLRRLGWDSLKLLGDRYMAMYARFGFSDETLDHYLKNCPSTGFHFEWPPPGVAYHRLKP